MQDGLERSELGPVRTESAPLRHKINLALRRAIERGVFKPGERLIEKDLCSRLNVSRTSLREALRELEAHQVIANSTQKGLIVAVLTTADAENIYRIRAELEALIAQQFIERASPSDLLQLKAAAEKLKASYMTENIREILDSKREFYDRFCHGAHNPIAFDLLQTLQLRTSHLRSNSFARETRRMESIVEISEIVRCIENRDVEGARTASRKHVYGAMASAVPALT